MFWGVTLESGKRYSQIVESSYHLSMAALEPISKEVEKSNKYVSVVIEHGKSEFLLCTLEHDRVMQVPLDLVFVEGEEVSFFLNGEGIVHLTGYVTDERQEVNDSYSENSEEECETSGDEEEEDDDGDDDYYSKLMEIDEDSDESSNEEWVPKKSNKRKNCMKKDKLSKGLKGNFKTDGNSEDSVAVLEEEKAESEDFDDFDFKELNAEELNELFKPKSKKFFKKEEKHSLSKEQSTMKTSTPFTVKKTVEDQNQLLNKQINCSSIKKRKKMSNKQKFPPKNKSFEGGEGLFRTNFASKKRPKKET